MKDIQKTLPKHKRRRSKIEKLIILAESCFGLACLLIWKEAPRPNTPQLAVNKWIHWFRKNADTLPPVRGHVAILALRNQTWTDWAFFAACWMRRLGLAPVVLFSKRDIQKIYGKSGQQSLKQKIMNGSLWEQLEQIPDIVSINVDEMPEPSSDSLARFDDYISKQAHTNAAYELLVEEYEQGPMKNEYDRLVVDISKELLQETGQAYELLIQLKSKYGIERFLGYSGTIGRSACYEGAAKEVGLFRVWVEGWSILPGLMRYNMNKPALNFNVKEWVDRLEWTEDEQLEMERFLSFQETDKADDSDKEKLKEHLHYQIVKKETDWPDALKKFIMDDDRPIFLLAPNVVGDSATFQRQTIFESQRSWLFEVIQYFKAHPDKRLIIRAHPSERVYKLRGELHVNLGMIAAEAAEDVENIYVVQWQDPVNTYSLIPYCRAGLTWVSNTGVDLVIRNVPAISAAFPIYGGLGITKEPQTKEEYFSLIELLSRHEEEPSAEQKVLARKYLCVIYKKIGFPGIGPRYQASGLLLDQPLSSECGNFYRILAGLE